MSVLGSTKKKKERELKTNKPHPLQTAGACLAFVIFMFAVVAVLNGDLLYTRGPQED